MEQTKYDVFISYRRHGGSTNAQLVKAELIRRNFDEDKIYMDTHSLHEGFFDQRLLDAISASRSVVLVISKDCFAVMENVDAAKTEQKKDFLLQEIQWAIEQKKNIVPMLFDNLRWEDVKLPDSISMLSSLNSVTYNHEYPKASFDKLLAFLNPPSKKKRLIFWASTFLILVVIAFFSYMKYTTKALLEWPVTQQRVLTEKDLEGYSKEQLRIMRNEIFARHGYIFKTYKMRNYFNGQYWYKPDTATVVLSEIEIKNVELMKSMEDMK